MIGIESEMLDVAPITLIVDWSSEEALCRELPVLLSNGWIAVLLFLMYKGESLVKLRKFLLQSHRRKES